MKVLLSNKVSTYINNLPQDQNKSYIDKFKKLITKSKTEILNLEDIVDLSENESIKFYAYFISDGKYAVFAFNEKNNIIIVDLIELTNSGIKSLTISAEDANATTQAD